MRVSETILNKNIKQMFIRAKKRTSHESLRRS